MLTPTQLVIKRIFDITISLLLLPILIVPMIVLIPMASWSTGTWGVFVQERIGYKGDRFKLFKIRTLKGSNHFDANEIKASETTFGSWLRKTKLDELPQLFNVLKGDMSWVGPRPDIPGYADVLVGENRVILEVKPGVTGPATLKYKNEDSLLLEQPDPKQYNDEIIWPDKVAINKEYIRDWSLAKDLNYLWRSVFN
ncbi:MAG: sugar transferase [Flavobacteriaceae bacterium]|nr:sugar transferase [Flavobacteriaceae bacterium]